MNIHEITEILLKKNIISVRERSEIVNERSHAQKIHFILDVVKQKDKRGIKDFLEALRLTSNGDVENCLRAIEVEQNVTLAGQSSQGKVSF